MYSKETIDYIIMNCQQIEQGVKELSQGVDEFKQSMEKQPSFVQPFVKRDFESGVGLSIEKLKRLLGHLMKCFTGIENDLKELEAAYDKKEDETEISVAITKLKDSSTLFLNAANVLIKTMSNMITYLQSLPDKINMIPQQFLNNDERKSLLQLMPGYQDKAKSLSQLFVSMQDQLDLLIHTLAN
ncbi:MAG TPA: hypothetical protein VED16_04070 [Candidatus Acidoferrum sp.]|nr:hypothetical protein [Candidatus Acidoferrum sp.]